MCLECGSTGQERIHTALRIWSQRAFTGSEVKKVGSQSSLVGCLKVECAYEAGSFVEPISTIIAIYNTYIQCSSRS